MALGVQVTVINATTNATADSGVIDLTAIAMKFAIQLVVSGQIGKPTMNVQASCDGVNFAPVEPSPLPQIGRWLEYQTPARYLRVTLGGNNGTAAVFVVGQTD